MLQGHFKTIKYMKLNQLKNKTNIENFFISIE